MTLERATIAFALLAVLAVPAATAAAQYPLVPQSQPVQSALAYLRSQQRGDGSIGDDSVTAWTVMAIASAGQDPGAWRAPGSQFSPVDYLARVTPRLTTATDWERQLLAVVAAHRDPHSFGGADVQAQVQSFFAQGQYGSSALVNDDVFAILSLRGAGVAATDGALQSSLAFVRSAQNLDGGWGYQAGGLSSVDDTAATVMAMARMGVGPGDAAVQDAVAFLHTQQLADGGMPSLSHGGTVSNVASDAWAIQALTLVGEDPNGPAWTAPSGATLVDNLLALQGADGSFQWDGVQRVGPIWMTAYAVPAMLGDAYPVA